MENNKWFKIVSISIGVLLVISLMMNYSMANKLTLLENRVDEILGLHHTISSNINYQTNQIQNTLNEIEQQNTWLGAVNFKPPSNNNNEESIVFEWQVKEMEPEAEVFFHYVLGSGEDFQTVSAEESQKGLYRVEIPIDIKIEPNWIVSVFSNDYESVKEETEFSSEREIRYYISMENSDGSTRSGDIENADISILGTQKYGHIDSNVHLNNSNVNITLAHFYEPWQKEIVQATILKYENNNLLQEVNMEIDHQNETGDMTMFVADIKKYDDMRLVIRVEYDDGETVEKEVF